VTNSPARSCCVLLVPDPIAASRIGLTHQTCFMGSTTAPTWLVLLAPAAAILAAGIGAWTARLGWHAERRREHQRWRREQRTGAYLGFLDTSNDMLWEARAGKAADANWVPQVEWLEPLDKALLRIQIFGSAAVADQAKLAIDAFEKGARASTSADSEVADLKALRELLRMVRNDLGAGST